MIIIFIHSIFNVPVSPNKISIYEKQYSHPSNRNNNNSNSNSSDNNRSTDSILLNPGAGAGSGSCWNRMRSIYDVSQLPLHYFFTEYLGINGNNSNNSTSTSTTAASINSHFSRCITVVDFAVHVNDIYI